MRDPLSARFERLPLSELNAPKLKAVLELWQTKRGSRIAPARRDFDPVELKPVLPCVTLVDVRHEPLDFIYRLVGTEMVRSYGHDMTGMSVRDLQVPEFRERVLRDLTELIRTREPQFTAHYFTNPAGNLRAYRLLRLPLSSDGERIDMLLLVAEFDIPARELREIIDSYNRRR
jgi:hypothetical protein